MSSSTFATSSTPMSSPPKSPSRRPSRFIEGTAVTRPELLQQTPSSNELLFTILSEMDAHEAHRKPKRSSHRGSSSSVDSFISSTASSPTTDSSIPKEREGRRSINFGRLSMDTRPRDELSPGQGDSETETIAKKFKGRLRAWTAGKDRDVKTISYQGT